MEKKNWNNQLLKECLHQAAPQECTRKKFLVEVCIKKLKKICHNMDYLR